MNSRYHPKWKDKARREPGLKTDANYFQTNDDVSHVLSQIHHVDMHIEGNCDQHAILFARLGAWYASSSTDMKAEATIGYTVLPWLT